MKNLVLRVIVTAIFWSNSASSAVNLGIVSGYDILSSGMVTKTAVGRKGLVIVFLSSVCPCSHSHIDELKSLSQHYSEFSFVAVHSNSEEDALEAKKYFTSLDLKFPVIQDLRADLANRYAALKTPHAFIISPEGKVVYQGGISNSRQLAQANRKYLREVVAEINQGKTVTLSETRTLGCVISRGDSNAH